MRSSTGFVATLPVGFSENENIYRVHHFSQMGICGSITEIVVNSDGTKTYPSTWSHYKVLILGTGGSGKSTIFKQCAIIGDGIKEGERARWSVRIFCGLLQVARALVSAGAPHEATEEEVALLMAGGGAAEMAIYEELADWTLCLPLLSCVHTVLGSDPIKSCQVLEVRVSVVLNVRHTIVGAYM